MNTRNKHIIKYTLSAVLLALTFLILIPYFTTDFSNLRQQEQEEENYQRLKREELAKKEAEEKAKKELEQKIYLTGKFDPAQREDFILIPTKYTFGGNKMYIRKETYDAFLKMRDEATLKKIDLRIVSATRNFDYQRDLWNNKWTGVTFVDGQDLSKSIPDGLKRFNKILEFSAVPGTSRHHWGTDIDINGVNPTYFDTPEGEKQYEWLKENALLFGFCQTYNVKDINRPTGYSEEKWHWTYLPLSRNFTQEYKNLIKDEDIKGFLGDEYVQNFNLINDYVLGINPQCI